MIQTPLSKAHFWMNCAGYPSMTASLPPTPPSDAAMEGTCAAWVAEMVLTGQAQCAADLIDQTHPENGWIVDADMAHHIQKYVDKLLSFDITTERVEQKLALTPEIPGRSDWWGFDRGYLHVVDLKYGFRLVEPQWNDQGIGYAGAVIRSNPDLTVARVMISIYQPRAAHPLGPFRTWDVSVSDLFRRVKQIEIAARNARAADPFLTSGAHCDYCEAAHTCPAVANFNYAAFDALGGGIVSQQRQLTGPETANELAFLERAEAQLKARKRMIEAEATARIERGEVVPGYMIGQSTGQRRWKHDLATIKALTGKDPRSDKMVTPAEMVRRGVPEPIVNALTEKPVTGKKLQRIPPGYMKGVFE
jgi:hypothetical protein